MVKPTYPMLPGFDDLPAGRKEPPEEQQPPVAKEFAPPRHNDLSLYICHRQEAEQIFQRKRDGYFDATAMCRAYGKQFHEFRTLKSTERYVRVVESETGIPASHLIESNRAGPYSTRGTWVHPDVALILAQWLAPEFHYKVNRWYMDWRAGRQPVFNRDVEPFVIGRMLQSIAEEQQRQTVMLQRIDRHSTQTMADLFRSDKEEQSRRLVLEPRKEPEAPNTTSSGRPKLVEPRAPRPLPRTGTED